MADTWRPVRTRGEAIGRAIQSMSPGSWQGKIAQAMPVENRHPYNVESLDDEQLDAAASELQFLQDGPWLITEAGAQSRNLVAVPEPNSEHLYINGLEYTESDGWSRSGTTISFADGLLRINDVVEVEYAWRPEGTSTVLLPYGSTWRYLNVADADATDHSTDSGASWPLGRAPFGAGTAAPDAVTAWPRDTSMWFRATFAAASRVVVKFHIEDHCTIWVNGTQLAATPDLGNDVNIGLEHSVSVPADVLVAPGSVNVIIVRGDDEMPPVTGNDNTYFDAQVEGVLL